MFYYYTNQWSSTADALGLQPEGINYIAPLVRANAKTTQIAV